jgi:cellulase/cellobiase CelA1
LLSINDTSYYSGAWRLLTMLLMTDNFPNFYEMSLGGGAPTNTPSVPTNTPSVPTNTPTTGGSCKVMYTIANQWNTGFTADVTIKNTGSSTVNGWTLTWTFPNNQQITNAWNTTTTQNGQNVSASNVDWNRNISSGGTASFGFQASYSGSNAKPTNFKLNGVSCTAL